VPLAGSSSGGGGGGCVLSADMHQDPAFPLFLLAALAYGFQRRKITGFEPMDETQTVYQSILSEHRKTA